MLLDANVILRYLLNDTPQSVDAKEIIANRVVVLPEVLAEVVYVLLKVYNVPRPEIATVLIALTDIAHITNTPVYTHALELFGSTKLDFVDCILVAYNHIEKREVASFDKALNKQLQ